MSINLYSWSRVLNHSIRWLQRNMKGVISLSTVVALWLGLGLQLIVALGITVVLYMCMGGWRFMLVVVKTLPRDVTALMVVSKLKRKLKAHARDQKGIPTLFYDTCDSHPTKTCFIDVIGDKYWSFTDVDEYSNRVANYFLSQGYQQGDTVALFAESSAQYAATWLGLSKIGVIPALINFNLRLESLNHCLEAANVRAIIYTSELRAAVEEADSLIAPNVAKYEQGPNTALESELNNTSASRPPVIKYDFNGPLIFIYTSGTTGLPKAAKVVHSRYFYMTNTLHQMGGLNKDSVIYDTLPLYHTAGGVLGIGQAFLQGCTVVIRKKFSASNFWNDCIKYNCTAAQYIGEICRYLLAQPAKAEDRQHKVRVVYGNGLRPQIWNEFKNRFGLERISEFYGATEGNANAINMDNTVGCVGFTSMIVPSFHPISVILVDKESGAPVRGPDGLCVRAPPGEPGELVGKIAGDALTKFDGYSSKAATSKKVATDVFSKGDKYFLTGDILCMDELGYLFFKDRTGDTFRWKGENVSTAEVEALVSNVVDKRDAAAYGVEIPGVEGRAGMVAIEDPDSSVDVSTLYSKLINVLPAYARPVFVRLLAQVDKTGTFKLKKVDLRNNGYNPSTVTDRLFYLDGKAGQYIPLTADVYDSIQQGKIRF